MDGQATIQRSARLREERRLVTVLFADVCGSTRLGESADPEAVRTLLARFFEIARTAIETRGGRTEKYIGDAVMAVFGLPRAHDDDPVRAVDAALEIRERVRADPVLGERFAIHLGVATGEVVATRDAALGDFLVTGEVVNAAARLQQRAAAWEILVAGRTEAAARDRFGWGRRHRSRARGERPQAARAVLARAATMPRPRPPLVDRESDLRQLELIAERCFAERRPYLVTLLAPAGAGKTRLVEEFRERSLPRLAPDAAIATAQCLPYGDQLTYAPMRSLLLSLVGLAESTPAATLRQRLGEWLATTAPDATDAVADSLLATVGQGTGSPADRATLFAAWRATFEAAAATRPLVLLVDDLHWSSDTVLDLLDFVLAPHGTVPILGLVLARPQLVDRRPSWGGGRRNHLALALPPLGDPAVAELVDHHLGRRVPEVVTGVLRRADGNPLFVGELVRAVREQAESDADPASIERILGSLPDTVQATVLARIDLLGSLARRTLQLASTFGRQFTTDAVLALDPSLAGELTYALEELEAHDVLVAEPEGHAFRHVLFRDVAYQTLTRGDRAALHARAAAWIERGAAGREDEVAELVAYHLHEALGQARAAGLPEDESARRGATSWLRRAATVDLRAAAAPEAARHLRQAIESADPHELPELLELLGDALVIGEAAADAYARAQREAGAATVDDRLRLLAKRITVETRWQGAMARRAPEGELYRLVADGERDLDRATDRSAIGSFLVACGFLPYWRVGGGLPLTEAEVDRRRAQTEQGLRIARELGDVALESAALDALSGIAQSLGRHAEAYENASQRLALADRLNIGERLDACAFAAWESSLLGSFEEVVRVTSLAARLMAPYGGMVAGLHAMAWRAHALAMIGDWDEALQAAEVAERAWNETGRGAAGYAAQGFLAALEVCRARGDDLGTARWRSVLEESCAPFEEASFARAALHVARLDRRALGACVGRPAALMERPHFIERALGTCLDRGWMLPEASLRDLLAEALGHGLRPLEAQVRRGLGLLLRSESELTTAMELAQEMKLAPMVGRLRLELGLLIDDPALADGGRACMRQVGDVEYLRLHPAREVSAGAVRGR